MLKITLFEFIVRAIPEAFIYILACYALSKHTVNAIRYIASSVLFAIAMYLIRVLPINYGVHIILNIVVLNVILISINKIDIIPAIKASIVGFIALFIIEMGNMLVLSYIFKGRIDEIMSNTIIKVIYGLPSLGLFALGTICYYYHLRKKDK
jgi:hypothetical protein